MAVDLSRVKVRDALEATSNAEPYWHRIRPGCFVGFCPSAKGGDGTWSVRAYDPSASRYRKRSLGAFSSETGAERFSVAKAEAERFADLVESGGQLTERIETVRDACAKFARGRPDVEARFKRHVYAHAIAAVKLDRLRRHHLVSWREELRILPALVSRSKVGEPRTRERALSTVNRDMAVLSAALNGVIAHGRPDSEAAWQEALRPYRNATGRRTIYLDRDQRRVLLQTIDREALPFVRALCLLPLRPGAMAAITVSDFDRRTSELTVHKDKTGKLRRIQLPAEAAGLVISQAADRPGDAPIFVRDNGKAWDKNSWKLPIAKAVITAGLPAGTTAYTLRHSTITDLVKAGLPILTIAQISGTSVAMIEHHYGHLDSAAAIKALGELTLEPA